MEIENTINLGDFCFLIVQTNVYGSGNLPVLSEMSYCKVS